MKQLLFNLTIGLACITGQAQSLPDPIVSPIQSGTYIPGLMGVRDFENPGMDGMLFYDYNLFLNADEFFDRNGNEVNSLDLFPELGSIPFETDISGYINSLMITYASPKIEFLGNAQYLGIIAPNFTTVNTTVAMGELLNRTTVTGGTSGFGDLTVYPLLLSWGSETFAFTGGYMFVAPTGRFEIGASDNVGVGYWSHLVQTAFYYYPSPQKATAIMLLPTYEFHGKIKGSNVTPGSRLGLDYGISQYVSERLEVTLQGGHAWQIGDDKGTDVYWDTSVKDKVSNFGGGVGYWLIPQQLYANAKYYFSYGERQHFNSETFQIQLVLIPGWMKSKQSQEIKK